MTLVEFLASTGTSQIDFAKKIKRTQGSVSRLCSGLARPSLDLAFEIERATEGKVRASTWVSKRAQECGGTICRAAIQ